jgi:signal peptidase I
MWSEGRKRLWNEFVFGRDPKLTLARVCLWAVLINLVFHQLFLPITVSGSSMMPTYKSGTRNLVSRISYYKNHPQRGDVVVIELGQREDRLIKRIVGMPGESIAIVDGRIQVNGKPLQDSYSTARIPSTTMPIRLGSQEYFVIGDNRATSVFGLVERSQIVGRVLF